LLKEQPQNAKRLELTNVKQCIIKCRNGLDGVPDKTVRMLNLEGSVFSQFRKAPKAGYVDRRMLRFSSTWHRQYFKMFERRDQFQNRRQG